MKSGHGTIFLRLRPEASWPHGRSVIMIASRVLIWVGVMVTMRNSGTGQLTIRADGLSRDSSDRIDSLTHGSITLVSTSEYGIRVSIVVLLSRVAELRGAPKNFHVKNCAIEASIV
jgi:hypothetical protein